MNITVTKTANPKQKPDSSTLGFGNCSPETTTTLLTGYTPIQNGFGIKKINTNKKNKEAQN